MTTLIIWLSVIGAMGDDTVTGSPSEESQAILLVEDESPAASPFARERASFVPPWRDRARQSDVRLPISNSPGPNGPG